MRKKDVKVTYHELWKEFVTSSDSPMDPAPFKEVITLLEYINSLTLKKRFFDLQSNDKFCYLDELNKQDLGDDCFMLNGIVESARYSFLPKVIDRANATKRKNPKTKSEGDIERTHFLILITRKEVLLFLEYNYSGIRVQNFINYLKFFLRDKGLIDIMGKADYIISHAEIAPISFMTQLESALKASKMEVYLDKAILGSSDAINFSDKTESIQKDVIFTFKAKPKLSLSNYALDLASKLNRDNNIKRIRVFAKNQDSHDVIIDTQAICMKTVFSCDVNGETGELNSAQVFRQLKMIAEAYL